MCVCIYSICWNLQYNYRSTNEYLNNAQAYYHDMCYCASINSVTNHIQMICNYYIDINQNIPDIITILQQI